MSKLSEEPVSTAIHRRAVVIIMILGILATLKLGASVFAPIGIAIFLVALAWPIKSWLNQHLPAIT